VSESTSRTRRPEPWQRALRALAAANLRYWPSVAPVVRAELARWRAPAESIGDSALRAVALEKLTEERFNAEVAATLATLAPPATRAATTQAIVSFELLFDYLDGRTELQSNSPIEDARRLFAVFTGVLDADPGQAKEGADWAYMQALAQRTRERLLTLPAASEVAEVVRASAERCAEAQTMLHASATTGDEHLREWAGEHACGSGLEWREYLAGAASSVLAVHALIAAASDASTTAARAQRIDAAYLAIGAVITMLDSLVDHAVDTAHGQAGVIRLYAGREQFTQRLCELTREALARTRQVPDGDHHAMTLAGVVAYYTTHPGAREPQARTTVAAVRHELSPTIWPTLAVLSAWRTAKSARALAGRP
jgi:tetraprenyl-beta-curcumene synthase